MGPFRGWPVSDCCDHHETTRAGKRPLGGVMRYLGWFAAFSGVYAMGAVCPFCGRQGCPTGAASAGVIGLVFASLMQWGRSFKAFLGRLATRFNP